MSKNNLNLTNGQIVYHAKLGTHYTVNGEDVTLSQIVNHLANGDVEAWDKKSAAVQLKEVETFVAESGATVVEGEPIANVQDAVQEPAVQATNDMTVEERLKRLEQAVGIR